MFDEFERLVPIATSLEQRCVRLFELTRDTIIASNRDPRAPSPRAPPAPPAAAPHYGFQEPAPPGAPRLQAEHLTPAQAQARLMKQIGQLRLLALHLNNCGRLVDGIAELLEHGTQRAVRRAQRG